MNDQERQLQEIDVPIRPAVFDVALDNLADGGRIALADSRRDGRYDEAL